MKQVFPLKGAMIILVVGIWCAVIARLVSRPKQQATENVSPGGVLDVTEEVHEDVVLQTLRDPFVPPALIQKKVEASNHPAVAQVNWPDVVVRGSIKNGKGEVLVLCEIDGRSYRVEIDEVVHGVQVIEATYERVRVKFSGETKIIRR